MGLCEEEEVIQVALAYAVLATVEARPPREERAAAPCFRATFFAASEAIAHWRVATSVSPRLPGPRIRGGDPPSRRRERPSSRRPRASSSSSARRGSARTRSSWPTFSQWRRVSFLGVAGVRTWTRRHRFAGRTGKYLNGSGATPNASSASPPAPRGPPRQNENCQEGSSRSGAPHGQGYGRRRGVRTRAPCL